VAPISCAKCDFAKTQSFQIQHDASPLRKRLFSSQSKLTWCFKLGFGFLLLGAVLGKLTDSFKHPRADPLHMQCKEHHNQFIRSVCEFVTSMWLAGSHMTGAHTQCVVWCNNIRVLRCGFCKYRYAAMDDGVGQPRVASLFSQQFMGHTHISMIADLPGGLVARSQNIRSLANSLFCGTICWHIFLLDLKRASSEYVRSSGLTSIMANHADMLGSLMAYWSRSSLIVGVVSRCIEFVHIQVRDVFECFGLDVKLPIVFGPRRYLMNTVIIKCDWLSDENIITKCQRVCFLQEVSTI